MILLQRMLMFQSKISPLFIMFFVISVLQLKCPQNQYIYNNLCQSCPQNTTQDTQNQYNCLCPQNQFFDPAISLCVSCLGQVTSTNSYCTCSQGYTYDYFVRQCLQNCGRNQYRYSGQCKNCPDGQIQHQNNASLCQCNNTQYFDPQQGVCVDCPQGTFVDIHNRCLCPIEDYIFINGTCQLVCGGSYIVYQGKCQQCPANSTRFNDTICVCQQDASLNTYYNIQLNQCLQCPTGTTQNANSCVCPISNYTFNLTTQVCEQVCPVGYFAFNDTSCSVCPQNALKCENNRVFCKSLFAVRRNTISCAFDYSWLIITLIFFVCFITGLTINLVGVAPQIAYLRENAVPHDYSNGIPQRIKIKKSYYKQPKVKKEKLQSSGHCRQCCILCCARLKDNQRSCMTCCQQCAEQRANLQARTRERCRNCASSCKNSCSTDSCRRFWREKSCSWCHCGCLCCCEACL